MEGTLVIVCNGGCGKTTEDVSLQEFWQGKIENAPDPGCLVPLWTCKDCVKKQGKTMGKKMELGKLMSEIKNWNTDNFPIMPSYMALLKIGEELGEVFSAYIHRVEHRIGSNKTDPQLALEDGVADVLIALCVFCVREKLDLPALVEKTWAEVSKRKFVVNKPVDSSNKSGKEPFGGICL